MSLGLNRGTVQLEPRAERWDGLVVQTLKILKSILDNDAIDIQQYWESKQSRLLILPLG